MSKRISLLTLVLCVLAGQSFARADEAGSLQKRIDDAAPGAEVIIPKGTWTEPLKITKALKLRGEDREACVIEVESDQPAIHCSSKKPIALENLTIRWKLATSNRSQEPQAAIVAKDSTLRLANVRVIALDDYARCPAGFVAAGFSNVTIEKSDFEGYEFTIQFGNGSKGTISNSLVSKSGHCGITAGPESTVNVKGTIITGSRFHGLRCTGGELNAENNLVIANKNRGFYLGNKSARGNIRENVIQGNGTGISGFGESKVKVHNNFISGSDFAAVDMRDGCRLDVAKNLLVKNGRAIVLFKELGQNRNSIGQNASLGNKTETEGFETAPALKKVEGEIADGTFTAEQAKGFGLTKAASMKPLWERWTAMQKTAAAE